MTQANADSPVTRAQMAQALEKLSSGLPSRDEWSALQSRQEALEKTLLQSGSSKAAHKQTDELQEAIENLATVISRVAQKEGLSPIRTLNFAIKELRAQFKSFAQGENEDQQDGWKSGRLAMVQELNEAAEELGITEVLEQIEAYITERRAGKRPAADEIIAGVV